MKKKVFYLLLLGFATLFAYPVSAQTSGGSGNQGGDRPHLIPAQQLFRVSYYGLCGDFTIMFRQNVTQATLFIYKDGILVDEDYLTNIQAGDSFTTNIPLFGTGLFTIYIQIGERMYAVFEEEIVE